MIAIRFIGGQGADHFGPTGRVNSATRIGALKAALVGDNDPTGSPSAVGAWHGDGRARTNHALLH